MTTVGIEVLEPGLETTVQSWPGRTGLASHGYSAAGPMDHLGFRIANILVGNPVGAAALEVPRVNLTVAFLVPTQIAVTAPPGTGIFVNDVAVAGWQTLDVAAGDVLQTVNSGGIGFRLYVAVAGGIDVPEVLGSRATSLISGVGGHDGRALVRGDRLATAPSERAQAVRLPEALRPRYDDWEIEVVRGPHATPDYLTSAGWDDIVTRIWRVDLNSDRIATRLGPHRLDWSRPDGGIAGGHPSNVLDSTYPTGGVLANGDVLTILGADSNTSGGFAVVATVPQCALWKVGQLRPGRDQVRFREVSYQEAQSLNANIDFLVDPARLQPVTARAR